MTDQRLSLLTAGNPQPLSTSLNAHYLPVFNALYDRLRFVAPVTYGLRLLCLSAQACCPCCQGLAGYSVRRGFCDVLAADVQ